VITVGIDTGGTFTDFTVGDRVLKVRSTPDDPSRAVVEGLAELGLDGESLRVVYGTTVATNALLTRGVARTAFVTTRGVEDLIEIGRQDRPALYALEPVRPVPLVAREDRFGVAGRIGPDGVELEPLDLGDLVERLVASGAEAVAVCLLHAYRNAGHEKEITDKLSAAGLAVSASHDVANEFREYERAVTTTANASLLPVMAPYVMRLREQLSDHALEILQSNGGTATPGEVATQPVRTVLSGPAGGVVAAAELARLHGIDAAVSFDMGGTSTYVARIFAGEPPIVPEFRIDGLPLRVPVLDVHTVGAGGGSIAWFDALGALRVGPQSAGAVPGPACYGTGELPTVTDAHLALGHLSEDDLLAGTLRLDAARAREAVQDNAADILRVANATMERAIRNVTVSRGVDPRPCTLIAFGGAGGLHACALADALSMRGVLVPPDPGTFSAHGMRTADRRRDFVQTLLMDASDFPGTERPNATVDARYRGQSHELNVVADDDLVERFHAAHEQAYGYSDKSRPIEIVNLRWAEVKRAERADPYPETAIRKARPGPERLPRAELEGAVLGPVVLTETTSTVVVPAGWSVHALFDGSLYMEREA
jgi:N-methylhydantoinase A